MRVYNLLLCLLITSSYTCVAKGEKQHWFKLSDTTAGLRKVLYYQGKEYAITNNAIESVNHNNTSSAVRVAGRINDATIAQNKIWIATTKGLMAWDGTHMASYFPDDEIKCVTTDALGRIWVGNTFKGVFAMLQQDSFKLQVAVAPVLSLATTPDSNIWIGTNIGMYRVSGKDFSTTRYAEEGYSGYELPDNLVEAIYADARSNVWVVMPDNLSFKPGNQYAGELPTFDIPGGKNKQICSIAALESRFYLFLTDNGLFVLPLSGLESADSHSSEEIHSAHNVKAFQIEKDCLEIPVAFSGTPITGIQVEKERLRFYSPSGSWTTTIKHFVKKIDSGCAR